MHSYAPVSESHAYDLLIRQYARYINAPGLPLYYRAFVYKLPK
jgi:hypothetical protein